MFTSKGINGLSTLRVGMVLILDTAIPLRNTSVVLKDLPNARIMLIMSVQHTSVPE
jgi:hypothetical protein